MFKQPIYAGPENEYLEEHADGVLNGRILYRGREVATLCYAESYEWGDLYAAAPELLAALELCRTWLASYRPLEANIKSDKARAAWHAANDVLARVKGGE